jgi:hypothetical protein
VAVRLPGDAVLVELRPETLAFETRECLLPGTVVALGLVMEGRTMPLEAPVAQCLVVDRDKKGHLFRAVLSLEELPPPDRRLVELFISKGRGAPRLVPGGEP